MSSYIKVFLDGEPVFEIEAQHVLNIFPLSKKNMVVYSKASGEIDIEPINISCTARVQRNQRAVRAIL